MKPTIRTDTAHDIAHSQQHPDSMKKLTDDHDRPAGHSLRAYWTTGTISALCETITELGGAVIELRDERGLVLDSTRESIQHGIVRPMPAGSIAIPIVVIGEQLGAVVVSPNPNQPEPDKATQALYEKIGHLIAVTASEMCTDVAQLRYRVDEIAVLYKLSSLLAKGGRVGDMLGLTLDLALDVLKLDAGAIMLLPEDSVGIVHDELENELRRSASVALSEDWLSNPIPLSKGRTFDRESLAGQVVSSKNLVTDERVLVPENCAEENLIAFLGTGMVFDDRPIGVIRLYAHHEREFTLAERNLIRSIAESAAAAVEQARLLKLQARERRMHRALKIAGAVQKRMLPEETPKHDHIELAGRYRPSQEIGGDFYDLFDVRNQLGVLVGDVVGKGVVAGLLMSAVRATIRAYAELSDDLARVMFRTNQAVWRDTTISEFVTIWYGMIDPDTFEMRYVVAGHESPLLLRSSSDGLHHEWHIEELPGEGLVVGVLPDESYT
ncbi:MAG: PP2C family protein-serine/threonine phosphatase, partial [Phycisphaerales bacterium]